MTTATPAYRLLGISDDVTVCECCGKADLKCTMALASDDGALVRFGRDCGARALGWSVSADRAEKLVRGTAKIAGVLAEALWGGWHTSGVERGARVVVDGVTFEVSRFGRGAPANDRWAALPKWSPELYARVAA